MSIIFMYCLGMREWYVYHIHVLSGMMSGMEWYVYHIHVLSGNDGVVCLSYSCIVWE